MTKTEFRLTEESLLDWVYDFARSEDGYPIKRICLYPDDTAKQILKNQEIVERLKAIRDSCYKNGSIKDSDWLDSIILGEEEE